MFKTKVKTKMSIYFSTVLSSLKSLFLGKDQLQAKCYYKTENCEAKQLLYL